MEQIRVRPAHDNNALLAEFLRRYGIGRIIGISGGSDDKLAGIPDNDPLQAQYAAFRDAFCQRVLDDFLRPLRGYQIAILTGGTKWGVPKMALHIAKKYGFRTIGVLPRVGELHALAHELLDLQVVVEPLIGESVWGDEGPVWTSLVDGLVVIGGGAGTLTELAHLIKLNEGRCKRNERPKFMVPLHGLGGVAEQLHRLWVKPDIRDLSMPRDPVHRGADAARMLIQALDLEEFFVGANN